MCFSCGQSFMALRAFVRLEGIHDLGNHLCAYSLTVYPLSSTSAMPCSFIGTSTLKRVRTLCPFCTSISFDMEDNI